MKILGVLSRYLLSGTLVAASRPFARRPAARFGWLQRRLQKLGDSSYSLYLTHTFSVAAIYKLAEAAGLITLLPSDIVVIAAGGAAIVGAHAVHPMLERPCPL